MIDWRTVGVVLGGSAALVSAGTYVLKRTFEHAMETRTKKLLELQKALVQEATRRDGSVFDRQSQALPLLLSLVYRVRNAARDTVGDPAVDRGSRRDAFRRLRAYGDALEEALFENRAVLPDQAFKLLHDTKRLSQELLSAAAYSKEAQGRGIVLGTSDAEQKRRAAQGAYEQLDRSYDALVKLVQGVLGVK